MTAHLRDFIAAQHFFTLILRGRNPEHMWRPDALQRPPAQSQQIDWTGSAVFGSNGLARSAELRRAREARLLSSTGPRPSRGCSAIRQAPPQRLSDGGYHVLLLRQGLPQNGREKTPKAPLGHHISATNDRHILPCSCIWLPSAPRFIAPTQCAAPRHFFPHIGIAAQSL